MPSLLVGPSDGRMAVGRTSRPTSESTVGRAKTCQDSSSLGSAARRLGQKDASETRSHSAEQTRGAWRVPRVPGWSTRLGRVRATRPKSCTCRVATNLTAVPRSSNSEGAGATVEELRSRVFATNPCNAKRFISHAEGEQLQEGALAGLQAGGRRGHGPLGVLPKCFDDRADERGGDGRAGPHGRRPGALPPFPFSASWQGRCCEGAAVQALPDRTSWSATGAVPSTASARAEGAAYSMWSANNDSSGAFLSTQSHRFACGLHAGAGAAAAGQPRAGALLYAHFRSAPPRGSGLGWVRRPGVLRCSGVWSAVGARASTVGHRDLRLDRGRGAVASKLTCSGL